MSHSRMFVLLTVVVMSLVVSNARGVTTTYSFESPPDNVTISTTPGPVITNGWPAQILDGEEATETIQNVVIQNELNNTIFFDDNALQVSNSSRMTGVFGWSDVTDNGPTDEPFLLMDFTNRVGGVPQEVSFDVAISVVTDFFGAVVQDSLGNIEVIMTPPTDTFDFGGEIGSEGHLVLTPTGSLTNIAIVRLRLSPGPVLGSLQAGIDNLTFDDGTMADLDGNGNVDGQDLTLWQTAFGSGGPGGDIDGDGDTDGNDFLIWQRNFDPGAPAMVVPEPSTGILVAIAFAALSAFSSRAQAHELPC